MLTPYQARYVSIVIVNARNVKFISPSACVDLVALHMFLEQYIPVTLIATLPESIVCAVSLPEHKLSVAQLWEYCHLFFYYDVLCDLFFPRI